MVVHFTSFCYSLLLHKLPQFATLISLLFSFKLFPIWIAPNLLTFIGWLFTVANVAVLAYYDWDFTAARSEFSGFSTVPRGVWLFCAVSQFLSHTLDGIDGKQARRTHSRYIIFYVLLPFF